MKRPENDSDALHTALESWDPVRREGEPSDEQVAAVRRRVRAAGPAPAAPGVVRWRLVLAAGAAVALLLVLLQDGGPWSPASSPTPPAPPEAAAPRRLQVPPGPRGGAAGRAAGGGGADVADGSPHRPVAVERLAEVAAPASPPEAAAAASPSGPVVADAGPGGDPVAAAGPRQIQIVAPGGTRIVWLVAATPEPPTDSSEEDT